MRLQAIGVVHSPVKETGQMPKEGVPATIEVFPPFAEGLAGIEANSHLIVIGWLHQADRSVLRASQPPRGVFGLRSPARPNPLGLSTARLLGVEGRFLRLERLDMIDGTPVVDLKRYSPGWDCIFAARSSRDLTFPEERSGPEVLRAMFFEVANFHGEACPGTALGAKLLYDAMTTWHIAQKEPTLLLWVGRDGCLADALQGLTGATLGNGRLKVRAAKSFRLLYGHEELMYWPKDTAGLSPAQILEMEVQALFRRRRIRGQRSDHA